MLSCLSRVQLFVTLRTIARQAPLSMGFSRQEYWSGLPCLPLGNLPNPGIEPMSSALQEDSLLRSHQGSPYLHYALSNQRISSFLFLLFIYMLYAHNFI